MSDSSPSLLSLDQTIAQRLVLLDQAEVQPPEITFNPTDFSGYQWQLERINLVGEQPSTRTTKQRADFDLSETQSHQIELDSGTIWLRGSSLLCTCPECSAPMTIRLWLGLADCWQCPTSIQLSTEQLAAAEKLLQRQKPAESTPPVSLPAPPPAPISPSLPVPPPVFQSTVEPPSRNSGISPAREHELERLSRGSLLANLLRNGFQNIPAWLISFILHMVIILILALIMLGDSQFLPSSITLSTFFSSEDTEGGDIVVSNPDFALQDDLERSSKMDVADEELRDILDKANVDAQQLQVDPRPIVPLPDITDVKKNITTSDGRLKSFSARDPRVRSEIVRKQGGTTLSEAAVSRGLRWLASVQNQDGGWSLANYRNSDDPENRSDIMATSLALLPMLGAGQTHEYGRYKECVARGLAWILKNQSPNGDLRAQHKDENPGMYAHGQATIVLCEAYALTGENKFLEPAQRAIKFIEAAQHGKGGWRYQPGQVGDTSIFGWQMMALQSAKASGGELAVDDSTLKLADYFLDQVQADAKFDNRRETPLPVGSAYSYQPNGNATAAMTAEAILCRIYLGWKKQDPRLDTAVRWLIQDHMPSRSEPNLYYWYYGTQVMHHYGGKPWNQWNEKVRGLLIFSQESRGKYVGSWDPRDFEWGRRGGRIYTTSLAVCTLEVYYRHLPIFHQIELSR